jgi:hypothetical protein
MRQGISKYGALRLFLGNSHEKTANVYLRSDSAGRVVVYGRDKNLRTKWLQLRSPSSVSHPSPSDTLLHRSFDFEDSDHDASFH